MHRSALLLAAPLLLSAADPLALAEREAVAAEAEQQRLERAAGKARDAAERAAVASAALAQAIISADARIAANELRLADLQRRRARLEGTLAEARRPATVLVAGLVQLGRRPQWLALAGAGSAEEQVRLAALVRQIRPEVERRSAGLRDEYEILRTFDARQRALGAELHRGRLAADEARTRFATLERQALATAEQRGQEAVVAEDRVVERSERLSALRSGSVQRQAAARLAGLLADLPVSAPRPIEAEGRQSDPPFRWMVPASGRVTSGLGELMANGVRSRGVTIAAIAGTQVIAPAAGRIAFAGPFRRRAGVVIVDHGGGWMTLLSEVRPSVVVGERIEASQPVGRALGPVTAELFQNGTPKAAALIARSS